MRGKYAKPIRKMRTIQPRTKSEYTVEERGGGPSRRHSMYTTHAIITRTRRVHCHMKNPADAQQS